MPHEFKPFKLQGEKSSMTAPAAIRKRERETAAKASYIRLGEKNEWLMMLRKGLKRCVYVYIYICRPKVIL